MKKSVTKKTNLLTEIFKILFISSFFLLFIFFNWAWANSCIEHLNKNQITNNIAINANITKDNLKKIILDVFHTLGEQDSLNYFGLWNLNDQLVKDLNNFKFSDQDLVNSYERPLVILKRPDYFISLVLFRGYIFAGNYFQSKAGELTDNKTSEHGTNYTKATKGQKAIEILPNGKWKMISNASEQLRKILISMNVTTLYRGMNEFQFDMQLYTKKFLLENPSDFISAKEITTLKELINNWGNNPKYDHNLNGSSFSHFPIWKEFLVMLNSNSLTREQVHLLIENAFTSSVSMTETDKDKIHLHKVGTYTTTNMGSAFHWAFDKLSKYKTGIVGVYKIDLSTLPKEDLKNIYFGIEGDYIEIGFFGPTIKAILVRSLQEEGLMRDDDPRSKPLWRRNFKKWNALYDNLPNAPLNEWD